MVYQKSYLAWLYLKPSVWIVRRNTSDFNIVFITLVSAWVLVLLRLVVWHSILLKVQICSPRKDQSLCTDLTLWAVTQGPVWWAEPSLVMWFVVTIHASMGKFSIYILYFERSLAKINQQIIIQICLKKSKYKRVFPENKTVDLYCNTTTWVC